MSWTKLSKFTGGLDTQSDPLIGDLSRSPSTVDMLGDTGLCRQRNGFKVLDIEPSHINDSGGTTKSRVAVTTDGTNDYIYSTAFNETLWTKWTLRMEAPFAISGNENSGTRTFFMVPGTTYHPIQIRLVGDGTNIKVQVIVTSKDGSAVTLNSSNQTIAEWTATVSSRHIRLVRDGTTVTLYIGPTAEATDDLATNVEHEAATGIYMGSNSTPGGYAVGNWFGVTLVNRVLTEAECYFGIGYPTDNNDDTDILGNWSFIEATGTTVNDYSRYGNDLTMSGATWSGESNASSRFLCIHNHRDTSGNRWSVLASGRRANDAADAVPSGAIYAWKQTGAFTPFYFGGDSSNDDATALYDGLDFYGRLSPLSILDYCYLMNGIDNAVRLNATVGTVKTASMTAPPMQTYAIQVAGGLMADGDYLIGHTYYDSVTGFETAMSPVYTLTVSAGGGTAAVSWAFGKTGETKCDKVRFYRSIAGGTILYLADEVAITATGMTHTKSDTQIQTSLVLAGSTVEGNLDLKRGYLQGGPTIAPTVAAGAAGALNGVHVCAYSWKNSTTGDETGMSPIAYTGALSSKKIDWSALQVPPSGSQYDLVVLYRYIITSATTIYQVQSFSATTSYTGDNATGTITVDAKGLMPIAPYCALFANRMWVLNGSTLYWSSPGDYESFPWLNASVVNPGADGVGLSETEGFLYLHFEDGRLFRLPHPGNQVDLSLYVPVNCREWSNKGAAVSHASIQRTPYGHVWLSYDGFYLLAGDSLEFMSPSISQSFLSLNRIRAKYAVGLYRDDEQVYRCWLSRDNDRLNEDVFVFEFKSRAWWLHTGHADAAGVLEDSTGVLHYCIGTELGHLFELLTDSDTGSDLDGDGSGTLSGTVTTAGMTNMSAIGGYTAPEGGTCGAIWFRKSDGTVLQRWRVDAALVVGADVQFYPSASALSTGTWTAYFHGIRGSWRTMFIDAGETRKDKTFRRLSLTHGIETTGTVDVKSCVDEGTLTTVNGAVISLRLQNNHVTSLGNGTDAAGNLLDTIAGRFLQVEIAHDPPAGGEGFRIVEVQVDLDFAEDAA